MADGGGLTTVAPLTADLVARALIAAARSYGDDPVRACTTLARGERRALTAAAGGVALALDRSPSGVIKVLGLSANAVFNARARKSDAYMAAEKAAMRAAEFALWRGEAAASVRVEVIPEGPRTALSGATAARLRPPQPPPLISTAGLLNGERPIRDLVLEALAAGPSTSMGLAVRTDRKELPISSTLGQLEREGLVESRPIDGPRKLEWALKGALLP